MIKKVIAPKKIIKAAAGFLPVGGFCRFWPILTLRCGPVDCRLPGRPY